MSEQPKKKIPGGGSRQLVAIRMDEALAERLKAVAKRQGVSIGEVVSHILREHLDEY